MLILICGKFVMVFARVLHKSLGFTGLIEIDNKTASPQFDFYKK